MNLWWPKLFALFSTTAGAFDGIKIVWVSYFARGYCESGES